MSVLSRIQRSLKVDLKEHNAAFLWGPRKVGKTTLLHQQFPRAKFYDLLDSALRTALLVRPSLLREEVLAGAFEVVVIDEIQKVPELLDEVHCSEIRRHALCSAVQRAKVKRGAAICWEACLAIRALSTACGVRKLAWSDRESGLVPAIAWRKSPKSLAVMSSTTWAEIRIQALT
jgi:hypothetical protein